jgi:tetratricopeptide (TPR) repeat protein
MAEDNTPEPEPQDPEPSASEPTSPDLKPNAGAVGLTPGQRLAAKKAQKAVEKREFKEDLRRQEEVKRQQEQEEADRLMGRAPADVALPESVERVAGTFTHTLQDNRGRILGGVVAAIAIAAIVIGAQRLMRSGAAEEAAQLGVALELANAPIDAEDADGQTDDGKPLFKSEQARAEKALAAFDKVAKESEDRPAGRWATLGAAAVQVELGKYEEARARFQGVYDAEAKEPSLAGRALEGVAIALEGAGKIEEAVKTLEKLKDVPGNRELANFQLARIKLAKGDREGGKSMLKALYDQLNTPSEGSAPSPYLKAEVEVRLAELDSTLVDKGSSAGDPQQFSQEQIQKLLEQLQRDKGQSGAGSE